jgi:hypothetical protein
LDLIYSSELVSHQRFKTRRILVQASHRIDALEEIMETVLYSNELFMITRVEVYDEDDDSVASFFELIEIPNKKMGMFDSYTEAEKALKAKLSTLDEI